MKKRRRRMRARRYIHPIARRIRMMQARTIISGLKMHIILMMNKMML
jgi:hypothetical protein